MYYTVEKHILHCGKAVINQDAFVSLHTFVTWIHPYFVVSAQLMANYAFQDYKYVFQFARTNRGPDEKDHGSRGRY